MATLTNCWAASLRACSQAQTLSEWSNGMLVTYMVTIHMQGGDACILVTKEAD